MDINSFADQYKLMIIHTHPEYWTKLMYDNLKAYLTQGGNLLYLGGNGIYERVEYDSTFSRMIGRPNGASVDNVAEIYKNRWFMRTQGLPEVELLGVSFHEDLNQEEAGWGDVSNAHASGYYHIESPDHWIFNDPEKVVTYPIGVVGPTGGLIGEYHDCNGWACGFEMDTSGPDHEGYSCTRPVTLLATGRPTFFLGASAGVGHMVCVEPYSNHTNNFVFSASSVTFCGSLIGDPELQKMMRNAMRKAHVFT